MFEALPSDLKHGVETFLHGVFGGSAPALEAHADELYDLYTPVRNLVHSKHGAEVTLYRGEPVDKPAIVRKFLSWTPSFKMATHFAQMRGYEVVTASVRVADVVAVFVSPHDAKYIEYLVRFRKSHHEKGQQLPLKGYVEFDIPFGGWSVELAQTMVKRLEHELAAMGGSILQTNISEEYEMATAYVLVPANVKIDENDSTRIGEFEAQFLEVYSHHMTASKSVSARGFFDVGDRILYGKYKNKKGRIVSVGLDVKGNPIIEIEPVPKGRKKNQIIGLYKIWHDPPPALAQKVLARYTQAAMLDDGED